jgi:hypothetical protein
VDFTGVVPGSGGFRMEPGEYLAECVEAVQEESSTGNDMITWSFKLLEGKFKNKTMKYWTSLTEQSLWKLQDLLVAFGEEPPTSKHDIDLTDYPEQEVLLVVGDDMYEGKVRSKIMEVLPADEADDGEEDPEEDEDEREDARPAARARRGARSPDREEAEGDQDARQPRGGRRQRTKLEPLDADTVQEMEVGDLKQTVTKYGLSCDLDDYKTLRRKRSAVIEALEEADYLAEAGD